MGDQDSNSVIHQGKLISLHKEKVELREGGHTFFDIVKHPGGAVIAAIDDQANICLLKQWRHALNKDIWEAPAGCLELNEQPLKTAQRELEEEAGVRAGEWHDLGQIVSTPGFCNEVLHLFLATQISPGTVKLDSAEQLEAHWIPLNQAKEMAISGEIEDSKTLAILLRIENHAALKGA